MWLENKAIVTPLAYQMRVSILLLMDVAGKLHTPGFSEYLLRGFNPSSNGCGWKTGSDSCAPTAWKIVSILLLMDVAGKPPEEKSRTVVTRKVSILLLMDVAGKLFSWNARYSIFCAFQSFF